MYIKFTNGENTILRHIESDYISAIFEAAEQLTENEEYHIDHEDGGLWNAAHNALINLCDLHAQKIRESLDLGETWDWDFLLIIGGQ